MNSQIGGGVKLKAQWRCQIHKLVEMSYSQISGDVKLISWHGYVKFTNY